MTKTIYLENGKELMLANNIAWFVNFRDQFGQDIVPVLMPLIASIFSVMGDVALITENTDVIKASDINEMMNSDSMTDALVRFSGLEFTDFLNITWAMAKAADKSTPEPRKWIEGFEEFPLDIVMPEVFDLAVRGVMSTKKVEWLQEKWNSLKASLQSKTIEK